MLITIDTDICFECGEPSGEMHHVIPKSRGGTKTIPLCVECHCKVHGLKNRPEHRRLTIEGLAKAKANGVKLGKVENFTNETRLKGSEKTKSNYEELNKQVTKIIVRLRNEKRTFDSIAQELNTDGYKSATGSEFTKQIVKRLFDRATK